jgi:hypothetical protein
MRCKIMPSTASTAYSAYSKTILSGQSRGVALALEGVALALEGVALALEGRWRSRASR